MEANKIRIEGSTALINGLVEIIGSINNEYHRPVFTSMIDVQKNMPCSIIITAEDPSYFLVLGFQSAALLKEELKPEIRCQISK